MNFNKMTKSALINNAKADEKTISKALNKIVLLKTENYKLRSSNTNLEKALKNVEESKEAILIDKRECIAKLKNAELDIIRLNTKIISLETYLNRATETLLNISRKD